MVIIHHQLIIEQFEVTKVTPVFFKAKELEGYSGENDMGSSEKK